MGLAIAATRRGHPPAALATSHVPASSSTAAEIESLAAALGMMWPLPSTGPELSAVACFARARGQPRYGGLSN